MTFRGHGFKHPTLLRRSTGDGVTFRADCNENPEAWVELHLTRADLEAALAMSDRIRDAKAPEDEDTVLAPHEPLELDDVPGAVVPSHDLGEAGA